jgi:NADH-quinone oxidoreductase subunit E
MKNTASFETLLKEFPGAGRDSLIPVLQRIQDEFGYLSEESVNMIAKYLKLPASKVYGMATFYNQFRFIPRGKYHIKVCDGTSCHLEGAGTILKEMKKLLGISDGETTRDGFFSLEVLSCIGACNSGPVISVNDEYFTHLTREKLKGIITSLRETEQG